MSENWKASDDVTLLGGLDPVSQGAGTVLSGYVDASKFNRYLIVLRVGLMATNATLDAKLRQATDGLGTGVKDITGKAITQLTDAGTDDNKQVLINLRREQLDINNGFAYFVLSVTAAVAASLISASIFGLDARYAPGTHVATVDEVVS